jgi:hypothetical protein
LADAPPATLNQLALDWRAVQTATRDRVSPQRTSAGSAAWRLWGNFCDELSITRLPPDPIPLLQIFAQRLRSGTLCPSRGPVRTRSVEDAIRAVGQAYAGMGAADPRLNAHGAIDFRLTSLYRSWTRVDDPPSRVKPLPLSLLTQCVALAHQDGTPLALAAADCLVFGFYFLLRPGEYLGPPNNALDTTFRLRDIGLWIGSRALDLLHCPIADLHAATFATVTFTRQKNGIRNETIGHGRSGQPQLCPVICLAARVTYLRGLNAPSSTPLHAYRVSLSSPWRYVLSGDITRRLRVALTLFPDPSYRPSDVSARSTRAGGAMAFLCAGVSSDRIRLVGRWRSDELYRYLHVQAQPVMTGLSAAMLRGGDYRLAPE